MYWMNQCTLLVTRMLPVLLIDSLLLLLVEDDPSIELLQLV